MAAQSSLIRAYGETDFITGLRALAATMVVITHTAAFSDFGQLGVTMSGAGKYGVNVFFVISGFTIAKTFTETEGYRPYLIRRMFRILPLYWLIMIVGFLLANSGIEVSDWMRRFDVSADAYNLFMHLAMISYLDYRVANSILGVEWTIPIEVFWYLLLPLLLSRAQTVLRTLGAVATLIIMAGIMAYFSKKLFGTVLPVKWSPIASGHLFFIGALTFFLREKLRERRDSRFRLVIWGAVALFVLSISFEFTGRGELIAIATAILLVFASKQRAGWLVTVLTYRPVLFLGSISYSIYLIHLIVIAVLRRADLGFSASLANFALVFAITVALSTLTYVLVERPTNNLGRRVARQPVALAQ